MVDYIKENMTANQKQKHAAAVRKYDAANTKQIKLKLNKTTDADILKALEECDNVQGYIKSLIRKDVNK